MNITRSALVAGMIVLGAVTADAQNVEDWEAPAEARAYTSPLGPASLEHVNRGRSLFVQHCVTCHGEHGRGDGPSARLHARRSGYAPRDLSRLDVQANLTDGEIFWKISNGWRPKGKIVMPGVGNDVAPDDRWRLVTYVRSLAAKGGAP
jgi:mono/diheme cytochrome c family protein